MCRKPGLRGLALRLAYTVSGGVTRILESTRLERTGEKLTLHMPDQIPHPETVGRRLRSARKGYWMRLRDDCTKKGGGSTVG